MDHVMPEMPRLAIMPLNGPEFHVPLEARIAPPIHSHLAQVTDAIPLGSAKTL